MTLPDSTAAQTVIACAIADAYSFARKGRAHLGVIALQEAESLAWMEQSRGASWAAEALLRIQQAQADLRRTYNVLSGNNSLAVRFSE